MRLSAIIICLFLIFSIQAKEWSSWTVMVYIAGDNNLEGDGIDDINEMERGMFDGIGIRWITQFDRAEGHDTSNGNWDGTKRFFIKHDKTDNIASEELKDMGEVNMGDGDELTDFITYCVENFPARQYGLIIWNHGYGWIDMGFDKDEQPCGRHRIFKSIAADEKDHDELTLTEIWKSLETFRQLTNQKLDFLGFDACLMQQIDVAYQFSEQCDFIVGSELSEPAGGWPYEEIVKCMCDNIAIRAKDLCPKICEYYHQSYSDFVYFSTTQSTVDCSRLPETVSLISNLSRTMLDLSISENFSSIITSATACESNTWDDKVQHYYVDLYSLADKLAADSTYSAIPDVKNLCTALKEHIFDGQISGEVEDKQVSSSFSSTHPVKVRVFREQWKQNLISPKFITKYLPEEISVYNWDPASTSATYSVTDSDSGFSDIVSVVPNYGGSFVFRNSKGMGYSVELYPTVHHTACPSTQEYKDIAGKVTITATGKSNVERLVRANFTKSVAGDVDVSNAGGISIWFPLLRDGQQLPSEWEIDMYRNINFARDTYWDELIIYSLGTTARKAFLGYPYIERKAEAVIASTNNQLGDAIYDLKAELKLNLETGLTENVDRFVKNFSFHPKLAPVCKELGHFSDNRDLIRQKSNIQEE